MMMNLKNCYSGKKVFLTGHTGFKGSWFLQLLNILGAEVMGYALKPENSNDLYNLINGDQLCNSVIADIRDTERVCKEINTFQPDFIFHFAAQPLVRLSYDIPVDTFTTNTIGTVNVLDALRFLNKPCIVVIITTDKVYHNIESNYFYSEIDRLGGYDPYSASKTAAEIVIDSYRNSYFNPKNYHNHQKSISVARAGNVIGGGDWSKDRIIPDIVKAISNNEALSVRNPSAVRPWQHVLEPLHGYLMLAFKQSEKPQLFADAFNFGPYPTDNLTVEQLVNQAILFWGQGQYIKPQIPDAPHEAGLLQLNIEKAINQLSWKPKMTSEEAIDLTLSWYKSFFNNSESADTITKKQIDSFFEKI